MKKVLLLPAVLLLMALPINSLSYRIALSDFAVHSDNINYKYMGKGISEMIAVELAKSKEIDLIKREKRVDVLELIEFALSDLADANVQVQVGKMLAAKYLVFGEIVDMDKEILISLRMIDVESTKVVWNEQIVAGISNYDYITGYFTQSILIFLGLSIAQTTTAKVAFKGEKNEEVVIAFAKAVDHYDRKEDSKAKEQLFRARRIDPDNDAVRVYLSKLIVNLSKFRVEAAEMQMPIQNPAYLGVVQYAQLFTLFSMDGPGLITPDLRESKYTELESYYDLEYRGQYAQIYFGISFPLGERFGIQTTLFHWNDSERLRSSASGTYYDSGGPRDWGAQVNIGWAATDWLSLGIGTSVFSERIDYSELPSVPAAPETVRLRSAHCLGVLLKNRASTVLFDLLFGFSFGRQALLDAQGFAEYLDFMTPFTLGDTASQPILLEGTLTVNLRAESIILVLRQTNKIFADRGLYSGWLDPGVEFWVSRRLAFRGALDISIHKWTDMGFGWGLIGGITIRSTRHGWDLDLGSSYRVVPIASIPDSAEDASVVYINISKNLLSKSR
jgi:TolB-like protein